MANVIWRCKNCGFCSILIPPNNLCPNCDSFLPEKNSQISQTSLINEYGNLISLFTNGRRDYHNLTSTYVTGNSLLITAIAFLMRPLFDGNNLDIAIIIIPITSLGMWLCYNLKIAQGMLRSSNSYFNRELWIFEKRTHILSRSYFSRYHEFLGKGKIEEEFGEKEFVLYPWANFHKRGYALRMRLFPLIFGFIYGLIMFYCIVLVIGEIFFIKNPMWVIPIILIGETLGFLIFYFLEPVCDPSRCSELILGCFLEKWFHPKERLHSYFYRTNSCTD